MPAEESPPLKGKRPKPVTVVCALTFIAALLVLMINLVQRNWASGEWRHFGFLMSYLVAITCIYGFWKMRKWSFFTYTALFVVNTAVALLTGVEWDVTSQAGPVLLIGMMGLYYKRLI